MNKRTQTSSLAWRRHPLALAIAACLRQAQSRRTVSAVSLAALLAGSVASQAATFTVTNTNDAGPGSLRQAVLEANANPGGDTIEFAAAAQGQILLTGGELLVTDELLMHGPGRDQLTIDAQGISRILNVHETLLTLSGVTLSRGNGLGTSLVVSAEGAAVRIYRGHISILDSSIVENWNGLSGTEAASVYSYCNGGSYDDPGCELRVVDSVISGNSGGIGLFSEYGYDGVIAIERSTITSNRFGVDCDGWIYGNCRVAITDTLIAGNFGQAVHGNSDAAISISRTQIVENGGGVYVWGWEHADSTLRIVDSVVSKNSDLGINLSGIWTTGAIENTLIAQNTGVGIKADGGASLDISRSTISGNQGGISFNGRYSAAYYGYSMKIENSTISGNNNQSPGGGVYIFCGSNGYGGDPSTILNSTISNNNATVGGGIYAICDEYADLPHLQLLNTVVSDNKATAQDPDVSGRLSADYSLIGQAGSTTIIESVPGSNIFDKDPLLGPLQDNGGTTQTHALLSGSPAIDAGDPDFTPPPDFDQRGEGFERVVNGRIDMGAYEEQSAAWLQSLGDINGDGTPEIGVVARVGDRNLATVKDAKSGALVSAFEFDSSLRPVDVETVRDVGLDGALALLGAASAPVAEVRDVLSGELVGGAVFADRFMPIDLAVLPDLNASGVSELGMLGTGSIKVEMRDAVSDVLVNDLWFPERFSPRQALSLPDLNGNGTPETGVVLNSADETDQVFIKDSLTGEAISHVRARDAYASFKLLQADVVADRNGNGAPEIAMLLYDAPTAETTVWIADSQTGGRLARLGGYRMPYVPVKLAEVQDLSGDGVEEYALLSRNKETQYVLVAVKDGFTGETLQNAWFNKAFSPLDLAIIDDINNNGVQELVVLGRRASDGLLRTYVKDAETGELLNSVDF